MTKCGHILAILLVILLLITFLPVTARAEGVTDTDEPTQEEDLPEDDDNQEGSDQSIANEENNSGGHGLVLVPGGLWGIDPNTGEPRQQPTVGSKPTTIQDQTHTDNTPIQHTLTGEFTGSGGLTQSNQSYSVEVSKPQDSKPAAASSKPSGTANTSTNPSAPQPKPQPAPEPSQPAVPDTGLPFMDVWHSNWFFEDVKWAYENGLMGGMSSSSFAPGDTISLSSIVTVLARISQADLTQFNGIADNAVEPGKWYTNALIWAKRTGLLPDGAFLDGKAAVTRDELAVLLARYLRYSGVDVTPADLPSVFMDWEQMSREGYNAFQALHQYGVFKIADDGRMNPLGTATRAQFAALIHRVYDLAADAGKING